MGVKDQFIILKKKKKRVASHGDGEPLLLAKNDLPMHALCWQFRRPWRLHKVNFCGMDDAWAVLLG
jgi:hypothetical protein